MFSLSPVFSPTSLHVKGALPSGTRSMNTHFDSLFPLSVLPPPPRPVDFTALSHHLSFLTPHFSAIDRRVVVFLHSLGSGKCASRNLCCHRGKTFSSLLCIGNIETLTGARNFSAFSRWSQTSFLLSVKILNKSDVFLDSFFLFVHTR